MPAPAKVVTQVKPVLDELRYYLAQAIAAIVPKTFLALVIATFAPVESLLYAFLFVFTVDFVLGVTNAVRRGRFSSSGMRRGCLKLTLYVAFVGSIGMVERAAFDSHYALQASLVLCALTELISIVEHMAILRVPIPAASLILGWARKKAESYGVAFEPSAGAVSPLTRDLMLHLEAVRKFEDPTLRKVMECYLNEWYNWSRYVRHADYDGTGELVWERAKSQLDSVITAAAETALASGVKRVYVDRFIRQWNSELLVSLNRRIRQVCKSELQADVRLDSVMDFVNLMVFRLLRTVKRVDGESNPFETHPEFRVHDEEQSSAKTESTSDPRSVTTAITRRNASKSDRQSVIP